MNIEPVDKNDRKTFGIENTEAVTDFSGILSRKHCYLQKKLNNLYLLLKNLKTRSKRVTKMKYI